MDILEQILELNLNTPGGENQKIRQVVLNLHSFILEQSLAHQAIYIEFHLIPEFPIACGSIHNDPDMAQTIADALAIHLRQFIQVAEPDQTERWFCVVSYLGALVDVYAAMHQIMPNEPAFEILKSMLNGSDAPDWRPYRMSEAGYCSFLGGPEFYVDKQVLPPRTSSEAHSELATAIAPGLQKLAAAVRATVDIHTTYNVRDRDLADHCGKIIEMIGQVQLNTAHDFNVYDFDANIADFLTRDPAMTAFLMTEN